jgi:HPt (histidine-containing phosphotransfer) domain-containing protein
VSFEDLLKTLQQEYLSALPEKITRIRAQIDASSTTEVRESFHKLKGTGRTYGLPEVSDLAELVESICLNAPAADALRAATSAVGILQDIHSARSKNLGFNLQTDPRFQQLQKPS